MALQEEGKVPTRRIVLMGDSITVGEYVPPHKTWAHLLSEAVDPWLVILAAKCGRTTRQALEEMPFEVQRYEPQIVVVQFGHNDANRWESDRREHRVYAGNFMHNLFAIRVRSHAFGATRVFFVPPHSVVGEPLATDVNRYRGYVSEPQVSPDVSPATHLIDHVHLNESGHRVYADAIIPVIKKAIEEIECTHSES